MRKYFFRLIALYGLCFCSWATHAYSSNVDEPWEYNAGAYLWGAGIKGETATGDSIDVSFIDILEKLKFGAMANFEARKCKWLFQADVIYLNLKIDEAASVSVPVAGAAQALNINVAADLDLAALVLNFKVGHNVWDDETMTVDLFAGARYFNIKPDLNLRIDVLNISAANNISLSGSVWDAIVGVKGNVKFCSNWFAPYQLDVGTGDSDYTWQAGAGIGYRFDWGSIELLYRHLKWNFKSDSALKDIALSGPLLAGVYHF